jgi:hypothetical protein
MRPSHYWRKALQLKRGIPGDRPVCNASETVAVLKDAPEPALGWFSRLIAFITTLFKKLGVQGWTETGCYAQSTGRPVREAQHSTDGFWTIDLEITAFLIGDFNAQGRKFVRIEVEPGTGAHNVCDRTRITPQCTLNVGGAVVIDRDGPFLEIHPDAEFSVES